MSVVTGVFQTIEGVEDTTAALLDAGFTDDDIGVVVRDTQKGTVISDDLGREYASGATPRGSTITSRTSVWDRFPEGFDDVMRRDGLPGDAITWYHRRLDAGDVIMVINAGNRTDDAMRIVRDHKGELHHGMKETAPTEAAAGEYRLPFIEEEVTIEKVQHEVGEVRVTRESSTESVDIPTVVTHEQIRVERRKLDRPLNPDEYKGRRMEQGEICMPIVEDEIRVVKRPVIREELVITRLRVTEQKTLRETVTHTEPHVEKTGKVDLLGEKRKKDEAA